MELDLLSPVKNVIACGLHTFSRLQNIF